MYAHSEWENLNVDPSRVIVHFKGVSVGTCFCVVVSCKQYILGPSQAFVAF